MALKKEDIEAKLASLEQEEKTHWANLNQVVGMRMALEAILKEMVCPEQETKEAVCNA